LLELYFRYSFGRNGSEDISEDICGICQGKITKNNSKKINGQPFAKRTTGLKKVKTSKKPVTLTLSVSFYFIPKSGSLLQIGVI
jgi:hypothetical protein